MADARALLRAKRQEARISHPLASYSAAGQLRCVICGILVKHASAWEGHLGSKAHRTNVARIKEEERLREEARAQKEEEEQQLGDASEEEMQVSSGHKRAAEEETAPSLESKKQKLDINSGFPTDFFSDPSHALVLENGSGDEEEERPDPQTQPSAIDLEYQRFQKELLEAPSFRETYERATIAAEPALASEVPQGFPALEGNGETAAEEQPELTEEQKRRQKEAEERELIMDRLLEEERAQEEVDMKVQMMKNRVEAFKKRREAARAAKETSW